MPVIAIDGPAGAGKSTIARLLAKKLGFRHIDTGALYRGVAFLASEKNADLDDEFSVVSVTKEARFSFEKSNNDFSLHVNGDDVGEKIRSEKVSQAASKVSAYPGVRAMLLGLQRQLGQAGGSVLEGRDIGTVVFPDAEIKIFLTASIEERARRREEQLKAKGLDVDLEQIKQAIAERDKNDSSRTHAPLKKANDAVELDTSNLSLEQVLDEIASIVKERTA